MSDKKTRCAWVTNDPIYIDYHDHEWGIPLHDDQKLFELFILECMQAGLSWITVLKKRDHYRAAFDQFDAEKIIRYTPKKIESLMQNPGIIRNALKINAIINNAKAYLKIKEEFPSFSDYLWQFVQDQPNKNHAVSFHEIPITTSASDAMSKDLKKRGFKFVGSTTCYAFMQAAGLVNDHTLDCFLNHQR